MWVGVDERLPAKNQRVVFKLVMKGGREGCHVEQKEGVYNMGKFKVDGIDFRNDKYWIVTHWMPSDK